MTTDHNTFRKEYFHKEPIVLLGTAYTLRPGDLSVTSEPDKQGKNRLERGNMFFNSNKIKSTIEKHNFNWKLEYVQGSGHEHVKMSSISADILY